MSWIGIQKTEGESAGHIHYGDFKPYYDFFNVYDFITILTNEAELF